MKLLTRVVWIVTLAALLTAPAFAQDEQPGDPAKPARGKAAETESADGKPTAKKPGEPRQRGRQAQAAINRFFELPKTITLTEAQQEQVAALKKEFAPQARELQRKQNSLLTDEQKQARRQAVQELEDSGKKGRERQQAIQAALRLTPEQKQQQADLRDAERKLRSEIEPKLHALLTAEQKAELPKRGRGAAARNASAKPKNPNKSKSADNSKNPGKPQPSAPADSDP